MSDRSLLEYLEERLGEPAVFPRAGESSWHCPFCLGRTGDESSDRKLGINFFKRKVHCFRCSYSANELYRFFMDLNGGRITVEEVALLRDDPKVVEIGKLRNEMLTLLYGDPQTKKVVPLKAPALPPDCIRLTESHKNPLAHRAYRYLDKRGIVPEKIHKHDIRFCPKGPWAGHLIFPVYQNGEMVYWTTRTVSSTAKSKSKNPTNMEGYYTRSTCLLNYDNCVGAKVVAVSEGPFDVMAFTASVGTLGKTLSIMQVKLLEGLCRHGTEEIVIAGDAGEGKAVDRNYQALVGRVPKVSQLVLDYGDPDERKDEIEELMLGRREPSVSDRIKARLLFKK